MAGGAVEHHRRIDPGQGESGAGCAGWLDWFADLRARAVAEYLVVLAAWCGGGRAVARKAFFDYAAFLYFSKLKPRPILRNMAGHLVFLVIATVCADSMD